MLYGVKPLPILFLLVTHMVSNGQTARIEVHGHRGARGLRPENTLPAFEYAIAQGVDVLELDMAVTKDGAVVVSHDRSCIRRFARAPSRWRQFTTSL